jgi:hypothetical protein
MHADRDGRVTRAARLALLALGVTLVTLAGAAAGRWQGARTAEARRAERQAARLATAYRATRGERDAARTAVTRQTSVTRRQGAVVDAGLDSARAAIADSTRNAEQLRRDLARLVTVVATYRREVDSLIVTHAAYVATTDAALALADSTIAAQSAVIAASKCRILWLPCPSRTTVAIATAGVTTIAWLLIPRMR